MNVAATNPGRRLSVAFHLSLALLACAGCALAFPAGAGADTFPPAADDPAVLAPPCRLAYVSLDRVVPLVTGDEEPQLLLAQRAIERDFGGRPAEEAPYALVEIPGWKSEGGAAAMSLVLPGTGQLYSGSKRGYVFLGIEAAALVGYATFKSKSDQTRDQYYTYVGDPNDPNSNFSFDRLAADVSPEELSRLRVVYEKDPAEFYNTVTRNDEYVGGWSQPTARSAAESLSDDMSSQKSKSNLSLYTLMANHLVSAVDALHLARFNNFTLRENMTLRLRLKPSMHHGSYAFTLTQKF